MAVLRSFFNIFADDLAPMEAFYAGSLGFAIRFRSPWFLHVAAPNNEALEIGVMQRDHELVPREAAGTIRGGMLTLVVDDVDAMHERAKAAQVPIVEAPRNLFYGQRRMIVRDPAGTLIDISSECAPDPAWVSKLRQTDTGGYEEA